MSGEDTQHLTDFEMGPSPDDDEFDDDVWRRLDAIVPHYPETDDDLGEIRRIVNERLDALAALREVPNGR